MCSSRYLFVTISLRVYRQQGGAVALESNFPSGVALDAHACRYLGNSALVSVV